MKKVAIVTVAVLALGLAACNKNNADNNAANETAVENTARPTSTSRRTTSTANADAALNAAGNAVEQRRQRRRQRAGGRASRTSKPSLPNEFGKGRPSGRPFFCRSRQSGSFASSEEDPPLRLLLLAACRDQRPPAPTAEQSDQLNEAEDMLNDMANNEEGPDGSLRQPFQSVGAEQPDLEVHSAHAAHAAAGHRRRRLVVRRSAIVASVVISRPAPLPRPEAPCERPWSDRSRRPGPGSHRSRSGR